MKIYFKTSLCFGLLAVLLLACAPSAPAAQNRPAAEAGRQPPHPVDGAWQPDLAATAKISSLPANAPADLKNLTMTLEAKTGKMLLTWADGSRVRKTFKFISREGRVFRCTVSGVKNHDYLLDVSRPDRLLLKDEQRTLVFRRKPAAAK